jgi:hypothetical protein
LLGSLQGIDTKFGTVKKFGGKFAIPMDRHRQTPSSVKTNKQTKQKKLNIFL